MAIYRICRFVRQTLKVAPDVCLVKLEDFSKLSQRQSRKHINNNLAFTNISDGSHQTQNPGFCQVLTMNIPPCLPMSSRSYEIDTLESSALLYFSKVSSSYRWVGWWRWKLLSCTWLSPGSIRLNRGLNSGFTGDKRDLQPLMTRILISWIYKPRPGLGLMSLSPLIWKYRELIDPSTSDFKTTFPRVTAPLSSSFCRAAIAHCSSSSWFQFISSLNLRS